MSNDADRPILHKCRNCNRTDHRDWKPNEDQKCKHCDSTMDPLEVRYKCLNCGTIHMLMSGKTGEACRKCNFKVFVKPRMEGRHKTLKTGEF